MRKENKIWDRFSFIYDFLMKKDELAYEEITNKILNTIKKEDIILEIATGTGNIALKIAEKADKIVAVDFSDNMIEIAKEKAKKRSISNVKFQIQDAYNLEFESNSFDVVVISNALHIMTDPDKALLEIRRVLRPTGILIAPTFVHAESKKAMILSKFMSLTGFRTYNKWTEKTYGKYLLEHGLDIKETSIFRASFNIAYVVATLKLV